MKNKRSLFGKVLVVALLTVLGEGAAAIEVGTQLVYMSTNLIGAAGYRIDGATGMGPFRLTIPASAELPVGSKVTLQSVGFFSRASDTRDYLVLSDAADSTKASQQKVTTAQTALNGTGSSYWCLYNFNNLELTVGKAYPAHTRNGASGAVTTNTENLNLLSVNGSTRYRVFEDPDTYLTGGTLRDLLYEVKVTVTEIATPVSVSADATLSEVINNDSVGVLLIAGGDDDSGKITVTIDRTFPEGLEVMVSGNVEFVFTGDYALPATTTYLAGATITRSAIADRYTIPANTTLRLKGGESEAAPLTVNTLVVNTGTTLEIVSGYVVCAFGDRNIKGTLTIRPGAYLKVGNKDAFNYDGSPTLNVYGVLDLQSYRQTMRNSTVYNFYSGCQVKGYGSDGNYPSAFQIWNSNHTLNFLNYAEDATKQVTMDATLGLQNNVTFAIAAGVTVVCNTVVKTDGSSSEFLQSFDNGKVIVKTGGGKLVMSGRELTTAATSINPWNESTGFTASYTSGAKTANVSNVVYAAGNKVVFDHDAVVYVHRALSVALKVQVTGGATLYLGHDGYNSENNRNIVAGSTITVDAGSKVLFGYWANNNRGYAELQDVTIDGEGTWGVKMNDASYLKVSGSVTGTAKLEFDAESGTADLIKVAPGGSVRALSNHQVVVPEAKGVSIATETINGEQYSVYTLRDAADVYYVSGYMGIPGDNAYLQTVLADGSPTVLTTSDTLIFDTGKTSNGTVYFGAAAVKAKIKLNQSFTFALGGDAEGVEMFDAQQFDIADGATLTLGGTREMLFGDVAFGGGKVALAINCTFTESVGPAAGLPGSTIEVGSGRIATLNGSLHCPATGSGTLSFSAATPSGATIDEILGAQLTVANASAAAVTVNQLSLDERPTANSLILGISGEGAVTLAAAQFGAPDKRLGYELRAGGYYATPRWTMMIVK